MNKEINAFLHATGGFKALTLGLLLLAQTGCQLLPDGGSLLPNLKAAQLEPELPATSQQASRAQAPRTQDAESETPEKISLKPSASPTATRTPAPTAPEPQPTPVIVSAPKPVPSRATTATFHVRFLARSEAELLNAYPVRLTLEDANSKILGLQEIFPSELAQGITLNTSQLIPGDAYQVRVQGQVLAGKCLTSTQFLLKGQAPDGDTEPSVRMLATAEQNLSREDFVAQPGNGSCKPVLTVYGQVVDRQGDGIAGVELEATLTGQPKSKTEKGKLEYRETTVTDSQGAYTLSAFPHSVTVHLSASQGGYASTEKYLNFYYGLSDNRQERHDSLIMALDD